MKDIKEPNFISKSTKKTLLLVVNVILIVALLAIATYAWFFRNLADNVNTEEIQFTAGLSLEVSLDNQEYKNDIIIKKGTHYTDSALAMELTGDGIPTHFMYPALEKHPNNETIKKPNINVEWPEKNLTKNVDYISRTLYFRSTIPVDIYLTNNSYFKGSSELGANAKPLVWGPETPTTAETNQYRLIKDGSDNYCSKDCVVGATRAAFVDTTDKDNPITRLLWVPRPDIFCNVYTAEGSTVDTQKITVKGPTTVMTDDEYSQIVALPDTHKYNDYVPSPGTHWYYTENASESATKYTQHTLSKVNQIAGKKSVSEGNYVVGTKMLPGIEAKADTEKYGYIATTKKVNAEDEYYTTRIDVTIWIDGCDAEARKEFVGGKFSSKFQFVGISTGK